TFCEDGQCVCDGQRCGDQCVQPRLDDPLNCDRCGQPCLGRCAVGRCWDALVAGPPGAILVDLESGDRVELNYNLTLKDRQLTFDPTQARVLVPFAAEQGIAWIDLDVGILRVLSGCEHVVSESPCTLRGAGPLMRVPVGVAVDIERNRAIVSDRDLDAVFAV